MSVRTTRYTRDILATLKRMHHASNAELLAALRRNNPSLSATTVHRVTARLAESGYISYAPNARDGSRRYDSTTTEHDHFVCRDCDAVRDIDIAELVKPVVEKSLDGCRINGRLVVYGSCAHCKI